MMEFEQKECVQFDRSYPDMVKSRWGNPMNFRAESHAVLSTSSLNEHMIYVAMMLCRIFRRKSSTHFSVEWVSIMHEVAEGYTFN
jgi:hypothetical protein